MKGMMEDGVMDGGIIEDIMHEGDDGQEVVDGGMVHGEDDGGMMDRGIINGGNGEQREWWTEGMMDGMDYGWRDD